MAVDQAYLQSIGLSKPSAVDTGYLQSIGLAAPKGLSAGTKVAGMPIVAAKSAAKVHYGTHGGPGVYDITESDARRTYGSMEKAADKLAGLGYVVAVRRKGQRNIRSNHLHFADPDIADPKEVSRLQKQGALQRQMNVAAKEGKRTSGFMGAVRQMPGVLAAKAGTLPVDVGTAIIKGVFDTGGGTEAERPPVKPTLGKYRKPSFLGGLAGKAAFMAQRAGEEVEELSRSPVPGKSQYKTPLNIPVNIAKGMLYDPIARIFTAPEEQREAAVMEAAPYLLAPISPLAAGISMGPSLLERKSWEEAPVSTALMAALLGHGAVKGIGKLGKPGGGGGELLAPRTEPTRAATPPEQIRELLAQEPARETPAKQSWEMNESEWTNYKANIPKEKLGPAIKAREGQTDNAVLAIITERPNITHPELSSLIGIPEGRIGGATRRLESKGLIQKTEGEFTESGLEPSTYRPTTPIPTTPAEAARTAKATPVASLVNTGNKPLEQMTRAEANTYMMSPELTKTFSARAREKGFDLIQDEDIFNYLDDLEDSIHAIANDRVPDIWRARDLIFEGKIAQATRITESLEMLLHKDWLAHDGAVLVVRAQQAAIERALAGRKPVLVEAVLENDMHDYVPTDYHRVGDFYVPTPTPPVAQETAAGPAEAGTIAIPQGEGRLLVKVKGSKYYREGTIDESGNVLRTDNSGKLKPVKSELITDMFREYMPEKAQTAVGPGDIFRPESREQWDKAHAEAFKPGERVRWYDKSGKPTQGGIVESVDTSETQLREHGEPALVIKRGQKTVRIGLGRVASEPKFEGELGAFRQGREGEWITGEYTAEDYLRDFRAKNPAVSDTDLADFIRKHIAINEDTISSWTEPISAYGRGVIEKKIEQNKVYANALAELNEPVSGAQRLAQAEAEGQLAAPEAAVPTEKPTAETAKPQQTTFTQQAPIGTFTHELEPNGYTFRVVNAATGETYQSGIATERSAKALARRANSASMVVQEPSAEPGGLAEAGAQGTERAYYSAFGGPSGGGPLGTKGTVKKTVPPEPATGKVEFASAGGRDIGGVYQREVGPKLVTGGLKKWLGVFSSAIPPRGRVKVRTLEDLRVLAHETGHFIDWTIGRAQVERGSVFRNELKALTKEVNPFEEQFKHFITKKGKPGKKQTAYTAYRASSPELFADYVATYITDNPTARRLAPELTRAIEAEIEHATETGQAFKYVVDRMREFNEAFQPLKDYVDSLRKIPELEPMARAWEPSSNLIDRAWQKIAGDKIWNGILKAYRRINRNPVGSWFTEAKGLTDDVFRIFQSRKKLIDGQIARVHDTLTDPMLKLSQETRTEMATALEDFAIEKTTDPVSQLTELARNELSLWGNEARKRGLLNDMAFWNNLGQYFPFMYTSKEFKLNARRFGSINVQKLRADLSSFKHRMTDEEMGRKAMEHKLGTWPSSKRKIAEMSKEELEEIGQHVRETMGLIRDPAYSVTRRLEKEIQAVYSIDALNSIAGIPRVVGKPHAEGYVQLAESAQLGKLSGKWVPSEIENHIKTWTRQVEATEKLWDAINGAWKTAMVPMDPAALLARNPVSNLMAMWMENIPVYDPRVLVKGLQTFVGKSGNYKGLRDHGLYKHTYGAKELGQLSNLIESTPEGPLAAIVKWAFEKADSPGKAYGYIEDAFKTVGADWSIRKGASPQQAIAFVDKVLFDYSQVSTAVGKARRLPLPFITWSAKMLPRLLEHAVRRPTKYAIPYALIATLGVISRSRLGITREQEEQIKPKEIMGRAKIALLLPWRDKSGEIQWIDGSYFVPWGGWTDAIESSIGVPQPLQVGGPLATLYNAYVQGFDPFIGEIAPEYMSEAEQREARTKYVKRGLLPPLLGGRSYSKIAKTLGKEKDYYGRTPQIGETIAQVLGGVRKVKGGEFTTGVTNFIETEERRRIETRRPLVQAIVDATLQGKTSEVQRLKTKVAKLAPDDQKAVLDRIKEILRVKRAKYPALDRMSKSMRAKYQKRLGKPVPGSPASDGVSYAQPTYKVPTYEVPTYTPK